MLDWSVLQGANHPSQQTLVYLTIREMTSSWRIWFGSEDMFDAKPVVAAEYALCVMCDVCELCVDVFCRRVVWTCVW